jgi:[ribosomal protein S5]-alanine N-acetyltransferase
MYPELETERLVLRPLVLADAEQVQELFTQWEVVRLLNGRIPWPYPEDGVLVNIRDSALPAMERGEQWDWTLRLKDDPERIIGRIGLYLGENNRGFWLGVPWQERGLMTEAVIAVTDYWFDVLGFPVLRAPTAVENVGSRRISEKMGMRVVEVKDGDYVSGRLPTEVWEIAAEEWRAWRAGCER